MTQKPDAGRRKKSILDRIFPVEYDFGAMLTTQAEKTVETVEAYLLWLKKIPLEEPHHLKAMSERVDAMRYEMENQLKDAFSTPFDRQDIYSLSRQMDYIVNYSSETAREIYAFGVVPDATIIKMAGELLRGTRWVATGVAAIGSDQREIDRAIRSARDAIHAIDDIYIESMALLFQTEDPMDAMKKREVYHHMRDAGRALRATVDILHHVVVGIS